MKAKDFIGFFKPNTAKILIFLFVSIIYLYFASETTCGAGLYFSFCYKAHGFPFYYMMSGDIDWSKDYANSLFLGRYFSKSGNFLFNAPALLSDILLIYLLACFLGLLFKNMKLKN